MKIFRTVTIFVLGISIVASTVAAMEPQPIVVQQARTLEELQDTVRQLSLSPNSTERAQQFDSILSEARASGGEDWVTQLVQIWGEWHQQFQQLQRPVAPDISVGGYTNKTFLVKGTPKEVDSMFVGGSGFEPVVSNGHHVHDRTPIDPVLYGLLRFVLRPEESSK